MEHPPRHLLVILDPRTARPCVLPLKRPPEAFPDLERAAGAPLEPAGPPLSTPGLVLHRGRGATSAASVECDGALAALVDTARGEERGELPVPALRAAWHRPGWATSTLAWADAALAAAGTPRTGAAVVLHAWGFSHLRRLPTAVGPGFLKGSSPHFAREPVVGARLAEAAPGRVAPVVATDADAGLTLLAHVPGRDGVPADAPAIAAAIGRLQSATAGRTTELLGLGAFRVAPEHIATRFERLSTTASELSRLDPRGPAVVAAAVPVVAAASARLADSAPAATLVHGDLHAANARVTEDSIVLLDWSDACVAHPLLDLAQLLRAGSLDEDARRRTRVAYEVAFGHAWPDGVHRAAALANLARTVAVFEDLQASMEPGDGLVFAGVQARLLQDVEATAACFT